MDENLTRHADSRIHGGAAVLGKDSNNQPVDRDRITRFHENSMKTAVSSGIALPYRQTTNTYQCP
jgi:hypothetical protein